MANKYDYLINIKLLGAAHVGKTSLATSLFNTEDLLLNTSYVPTVGIDLFFHTILLDGLNVKLQIWDIPGSRRLLHVTKHYYCGGNGIVIVYDVTDLSSFGNDYFTLIRLQ